MDVGDTTCRKHMKLPENCVCRCNFSLEDMSDIQKIDIGVCTRVVTYVCFNIAQRHQKISTFISVTRHVYEDVKLCKYVVQMELPKDVVLKSDAFAAIHEINTDMITEPVTIRFSNDKIVLEVSIFSMSNPFVVEHTSITHIKLNHLRLVSYETKDEFGGVKRKRKKLESSS